MARRMNYSGSHNWGKPTEAARPIERWAPVRRPDPVKIPSLPKPVFVSEAEISADPARRDFVDGWRGKKTYQVALDREECGYLIQ